MAEVINLKAAKKRLARAKTAAQGTVNTVTFGQTKAQKALQKAEAARARAALEAHRHEP